MTAKTLNIPPLNAIFSRELGRLWPSWLYSFYELYENGYLCG